MAAGIHLFRWLRRRERSRKQGNERRLSWPTAAAPENLAKRCLFVLALTLTLQPQSSDGLNALRFSSQRRNNR